MKQGGLSVLNDFFGMILEYAGLYFKIYWRVLNGCSVNNSILSITQTADHLNPIIVGFRRKSVNVVQFGGKHFYIDQSQFLKMH